MRQFLSVVLTFTWSDAVLGSSSLIIDANRGISENGLPTGESRI